MRVADVAFSKMVRARDRSCQRCGATYRLECAHIFGRGKPATRHDPENAVALCYLCHAWLDGHPNEKETFFRAYMGPDAYELLQRKSNGALG